MNANQVVGRKVGESLWPGWFGDAYFAQERISQGPRNWTSLYQQKPTPDEGGYFERQFFQYFDEPPPHLQVYGASDYAVSEDHGDYTVHLVVGIDPDSDIYILDLWREHRSWAIGALVFDASPRRCLALALEA